MINVKIDSRKVKKGDIFVAIKGHTVDGHDYIKSAVENGAVKIIAEKNVDANVPVEVVPSSEKWLQEYVVSTYKDEIKDLNFVGITGTNGKTTTAYLTYQILNKLGSKTAYIGTIGFYLPDKDMVEIDNTTPNVLDLYELILTAKANDCKNVIMEVSSHSLHQNRVEGITFKTALFTNLTEDHLDYHVTMENYLDAKMLILKQLNGQMIVNFDDPSKDKWAKAYDNVKSLGKNGENYKIISYEDLGLKTHIDFALNGKKYEVLTNLKGPFNVYNYLSSFAIVSSFGYNPEEIIEITKEINPPKGRCEQIKVKEGYAIVDYAHTPDAVEKIISSFLPNKKAKVISLVGCGGDRDPKKRPIMGEIATRLSDYVIFTSDNPRTEDPQKIMDDILAGVKKDNFEVELDRKSAIKKGLDLLGKDDILLILGKGHEDYQILGHTKIHLDDAEEVKKYIENIK